MSDVDSQSSCFLGVTLISLGMCNPKNFWRGESNLNFGPEQSAWVPGEGQDHQANPTVKSEAYVSLSYHIISSNHTKVNKMQNMFFYNYFTGLFISSISKNQLASSPDPGTLPSAKRSLSSGCKVHPDRQKVFSAVRLKTNLFQGRVNWKSLFSIWTIICRDGWFGCALHPLWQGPARQLSLDPVQDLLTQNRRVITL